MNIFINENWNCHPEWPALWLYHLKLHNDILQNTFDLARAHQ